LRTTAYSAWTRAGNVSKTIGAVEIPLPEGHGETGTCSSVSCAPERVVRRISPLSLLGKQFVDNLEVGAVPNFVPPLGR